jgi:cold shock CspA family protein
VAQGTVKDFDPGSRAGTLLTEDRVEVHIDATSIESADIRALRVGQRVKFELAEEAGQKVARDLRLVTFA